MIVYDCVDDDDYDDDYDLTMIPVAVAYNVPILSMPHSLIRYCPIVVRIKNDSWHVVGVKSSRRMEMAIVMIIRVFRRTRRRHD